MFVTTRRTGRLCDGTVRYWMAPFPGIVEAGADGHGRQLDGLAMNETPEGWARVPPRRVGRSGGFPADDMRIALTGENNNQCLLRRGLGGRVALAADGVEPTGRAGSALVVE
jgi:hypothetical protein